jgi:hypothetical protein
LSAHWQTHGTVDRTLVEAAFANAVIATELNRLWAEAAARSPDVRRRFANADRESWFAHLQPRDRVPPSMGQVLERYDAALAKMPRAYYVMTLYGEAVGAAVERRAQYIRGIASDGP